MNHNTVLRGIHKYDRHDGGHGRPGQCMLCGAHTAAALAFAAVNGWRLARSASRNPDDLGRRARVDFEGQLSDDDYHLFDHVMWLKAAGRYVAVIGQPYNYDARDIEDERRRLNKRGFALHVPPDPLASVHNPGRTLFLVVTPPFVEVRWLPEQDGRLAHLWREAA